MRIFVLNCDQEEEVDFHIELQGYGEKKVLRHLVLDGKDLEARNTYEMPDTVTMREAEVQNGESAVLPKLSWNVIILG